MIEGIARLENVVSTSNGRENAIGGKIMLSITFLEVVVLSMCFVRGHRIRIVKERDVER